MERTISTSDRWLRAVLLLPLTIAGFLVLFFAIGSTDARADGLGDVLDSTKNTVATAISGVDEVTGSATEVVRSVAKPPADKPVKSAVAAVVKTVKTVATTTTKTADALESTASTTVSTVAKPVVDIVKPVTEVVVPEVDPPVVVAPSAPTPIAVVEREATAAHVSGPVAADRSSVASAVMALAATSVSVIFETSDAAPLAPAPASPVAPGLPQPAPLGSTLAAFAGALALVAVLGLRPRLLPLGVGRADAATDDDLPSTPTFDTDSSPD